MELDFRKKILSGIKWTTIERFSTQIIQFVIGIIVARLVAPADYGIVGMLAIFIAFGNAILDSGFGTALIRKKEKSVTDYSTVFFFNVFVGLLVYFSLYFLSSFISEFYRTPILKQITRIYALILFLNSLTVVQNAKLTSELRFGLQAAINIAALVFSGIVGVFLAYHGYGVWAIVWQSLSGRILGTVLIWIFSFWFPSFVFSIHALKNLFSFGSKMLILSFIDIIYDNIYALVIGKFYQPQFLGYYTRGLHIVAIPQNSVAQIVSKVSVPVLARYQDENEKLLVVYEKMFRLTLFVAYPLIFGLIVLAHPLVFILLGEKWLPCVSYLQILSFGALWVVLTHINLNLFVVKGRSDILLKLGIIKKIIGFSIAFVTVQFGMHWICFGTSLYALCAFVINSSQTQKILGYGLLPQIKTVIPIFIKSVLMAFSILVLCYFVVSPYLQVFGGTLLGMLVYFGIGFLVRDKSHIEFLGVLKRNVK